MKRCYLTLLTLFLSFHVLTAQILKGAIVAGKTTSAVMAPGEKHRYTVALSKEQFAFFRVMQKGIDLQVTTYDADGRKLDDFDSPNGANGPELVSVKSSKKGNYSIEIYPFNHKQPEGGYDITIQFIRPLATTPGGRVDELFTTVNAETPGAAVAIVKDGKIIYQKGYGSANLEYNVPITPASVFHIASVSKQFTAFSILLLEKEGKLSLDDDIRKYIPEMPDFGKTITLRHLASHTSGLRDQWDLLVLAGWRFDDVITKDNILKLVTRQKELNFNPGEEFVYCNTGFTLLAEVVSRVSGTSFADFTHDRIFAPLQMNSSLFYDDHEKIVKNRAYSYYAGAGGYRKSNLSYANVGATSLFTTVGDLARWTENFAHPVVGDRGIIDRMNTLAVLNNGSTFGGALGQFVGKYKGLNEVDHGGADAGYRSFLMRFPDQGLSIIVLGNEASFNPGRVAHQIADIYLADKVEKPVAEPIADTAVPFSVSPGVLESYLGNYRLASGAMLTFTTENGMLSGRVAGQEAYTYTALSNTDFELRPYDVKLHFDAGKDQIRLTLTQNGKVVEAAKVKPEKVLLPEYEGTFYSEELDTFYRITAVNDVLTVKHNRADDKTLELSGSKDAFTSAGNQIQFTRDEKGSVDGFKISTGRVRNLKFVRVP